MRNRTIISTFGFAVVAGSLLLSSSTAFAALCWVNNGNGTKTCTESTSAACTGSTEARCPIEGETKDLMFAPGEPTTPIRPKASEVRDAATQAELSPAGPTKVAAVPLIKGREMVMPGDNIKRVAKFKAGKALADTVKRNGNAGQAGGEGSGQLNREKYKKLNGDTFPPPPHLPEDDTCVSISNCP